jgi:AcrR family transcriptional regulator
MPSLETQPASTGRPLRADAARNRSKVLAAARATFAGEGLDAEMSSIAERADVGVGTVYRHFPTKQALLEALTSDHFERLAQIARASAGEGGAPWEVIERMVWRAATTTAEDHGMCEILAQAPKSHSTMHASSELREITAAMVEAGVADGSVRSDATAADIPMMMCGFGKIAALERRGGGPPGMSWRRYLTIMLDGLRAR